MTTEPETLTPQNPNGEPVPATEYSSDQILSPAELLALELQRLKDELSAMKKDKAASVELAEESEAARRDWEDLKGRTKDAKDRYDISLEALSKQVRGEVQTEIESDDQGQLDFDTPPAPFPVDVNLDAIEVTDLDWSAVEQSALSALVSTGKAAKVKPVEIMGLQYVLVDVQYRTAVFHQAMDAEHFGLAHVGLIGAERPDMRSESLVQLGPYAGIPVRINRKTHWLGASPLLVRIPPSAAISGTTPVDEADGTLIGNRIVAQLKSSGVERIAVDALAKLLGVERDIIQLTASQDQRIAYDIDGESVSLA